MAAPRDLTFAPPSEDLEVPIETPDKEESLHDVVLDEEIDALIGVDGPSLDERFTKRQLEAMEEHRDEYMESTKKQKGHLTRSIADQFIAEILETGTVLSKAQRKRILKVRPDMSEPEPISLIAESLRLVHRMFNIGSASDVDPEGMSLVSSTLTLVARCSTRRMLRLSPEFSISYMLGQQEDPWRRQDRTTKQRTSMKSRTARHTF